MAQRRVADHELIAAYEQTGNVHKAGVILGIHGGSVHERLVRMGIARKNPRFSDADRDRLKAEYETAINAGKLAELAASFGRTKEFLCRQARALGMTRYGRRKSSLSRLRCAIGRYGRS